MQRKEKMRVYFSSGGIRLMVSGQNLDVVQAPMMKSVYNASIYEFVSVSG
jgi:hypothetical protein